MSTKTQALIRRYNCYSTFEGNFVEELDDAGTYCRADDVEALEQQAERFARALEHIRDFMASIPPGYIGPKAIGEVVESADEELAAESQRLSL